MMPAGRRGRRRRCDRSGPGPAPGQIASNTGMDLLQTLTDRLTALEIKTCFNDDLLDTLNQLVTRQQDQIELLARELQRLRRQAPAQEGDGPRNARDELPPHY